MRLLHFPVIVERDRKKPGILKKNLLFSFGASVEEDWRTA
jgi:hypothetical protein